MRLKLLPHALADCDCRIQTHDVVTVAPGEVHHVCRSCLRTVAVIPEQPHHPTAATTPGINGGQSHDAAELERAAGPLLATILAAALLVVVALIMRWVGA